MSNSNPDDWYNMNNTPGGNSLDPNNSILSTIKGSMGALITGIFSRIYLAIAIPALYITYKVFVVLQEKGIIDSFIGTLDNVMTSIQDGITQCFPKLLDFPDMIHCFQIAFQ